MGYRVQFSGTLRTPRLSPQAPVPNAASEHWTATFRIHGHDVVVSGDTDGSGRLVCQASEMCIVYVPPFDARPRQEKSVLPVDLFHSIKSRRSEILRLQDARGQGRSRIRFLPVHSQPVKKQSARCSAAICVKKLDAREYGRQVQAARKGLSRERHVLDDKVARLKHYLNGDSRDTTRSVDRARTDCLFELAVVPLVCRA